MMHGKKVKNISIDWLRENHDNIRYFGLGFIQVNLKNTRERIHFYSLDTKPTADKEEIHDHRYNFTSYIIYGSITQSLYLPIDGDEFFVKLSHCKQGIPDEYIGKVNVELIDTQTFNAGDVYRINSSFFHTVEASDCITWLHRKEQVKDYARVLVKEKTDYCPFQSHLTENQMWEIVDIMIKKL